MCTNVPWHTLAHTPLECGMWIACALMHLGDVGVARQVKPDDSRIVLEIQERDKAQARSAVAPTGKVQAEEALQMTVEAGQPPLAPVITSTHRLSRGSVRNSGVPYCFPVRQMRLSGGLAFFTDAFDAAEHSLQSMLFSDRQHVLKHVARPCLILLTHIVGSRVVGQQQAVPHLGVLILNEPTRWKDIKEVG